MSGEAELCGVASDRIGELNSSGYELGANASASVLRDTLGRHKSPCAFRSPCRLANRLGVGSVRVPELHIRLHILAWVTVPPARATNSETLARRGQQQTSKERQNLVASKLSSQDPVNAMQLKYALCRVQTNANNCFHGWLLRLRSSTTQSCHAEQRKGAVHFNTRAVRLAGYATADDRFQ